MSGRPSDRPSDRLEEPIDGRDDRLEDPPDVPPARGAAGRAAARVVDTASAPWRAFEDAPGVSYKTLNRTPEGSLTLLLRFEPGASYPRHTHPAGEEYFVIRGTLDDAGGPHGPGSFVYHAPGSTHMPASRAGCEVLVFLAAPIERAS